MDSTARAGSRSILICLLLWPGPTPCFEPDSLLKSSRHGGLGIAGFRVGVGVEVRVHGFFTVGFKVRAGHGV